jgi:hypothetical protein
LVRRMVKMVSVKVPDDVRLFTTESLALQAGE